MRLIKKAKAVVLVPASFLAAGAAMAQEAPASGIDTAGLVSTIEAATGPVSDVGIAVLSVLATVMVFFLIRRVMR